MNKDEIFKCFSQSFIRLALYNMLEIDPEIKVQFFIVLRDLQVSIHGRNVNKK